jgi:hypothetical protein
VQKIPARRISILGNFIVPDLDSIFSVAVCSSRLCLTDPCRHRFLESYISRLTARLAQIQQEQGKKGCFDDDSDPNGTPAIRPGGSGELTWDQVQPLLTEYDEMIYSLQVKLTERQEELGRFELKLGDISTENAELVEKLKSSLKEMTTMVRSVSCETVS